MKEGILVMGMILKMERGGGGGGGHCFPHIAQEAELGA